MINNELIHKEKNSYFGITIILTFNILLQIILARATQSVSIIVGINLLLVFWLFYKNYIDDIITLLLFFTFIPFVYIDRSFSRHFNYIVIQNIPLIILLLLAIFYFFNKEKSFQIRISYVLLPVVVYVFYSLFLTIYGMVNHADPRIVIIELYQNLYFMFAIPIAYLLVSRKQYKFLIITIAGVFLLIAVQYIIIYFITPNRFTTYHSVFFPFVLALILSAFLFKEWSFYQKIFLISSICLLIAGSIATGTRTLLVTNVVAMLMVLFFYFKHKKLKYPIIKIIFISLFFLSFLFLLKELGGKQQIKTESTEQRIESISNPTGEVSFLMRIEAVYLGLQQIVQNPILGKGFGFQLQMRWLLNTKYTFPDNNFIYYWLKGGIIFFLIAMWMYFRLFKQSYKILKYTDSIEVKFYMVTIISGMSALMIIALMNANLIKFKLNIIYALIFAYVDFESRELDNH